MDIGTQSNTNPKLDLLRALEDVEYRRGFVEGHAKDTIAFQIRQLRKAKGWEQRDLARELGNPQLQPMISRYENPDYGRYSITTLLELAAAFDVALVVRFAPFSELIEWDWQSTSSTLAPNSYSKDTRLVKLEREVCKPQPKNALANFPAGRDLQSEPAPGAFGGQPKPQASYSGAA
jgi:transcriptional regulator with XRE-family HTH domain